METSRPSTSSGRRAGSASRLKRLAVAAATLVLAAGSAAVVAPAPAQAAGPYGAAFVSLDTPDASMCLVPAEHQWNSSSPWTSVNEVCQDDVGQYTVLLPGLAASAGTVQVTAYGTDDAHCKVASWAPSGANQRIRVRCFTAAGAPTDSQFNLSYANLTGTGGYPLGYVFNSQPASASYTPPLNYQFNSTGAANTITKLSGAGRYMISLPGLAAANAGNIQVTAYGTGSEWCTVWNWGPNGTALHLQVQCYNAAGALVDSKFTATYVRNGNILGRSVCCNSDGHPTAYANAHNPTAASYVPAVSYKFGFDPAGLIKRLSTGRYEVDFDWPADQGIVHVTAIGGGTARCKVEAWGTGTKTLVRCTTPSGQPVDATYLFHHVGPFIVG